MKYLVLIPDGMADEKIEALGNQTPMQAAKKPMMDALSAKSRVGTVSNVPEGMVPESDTLIWLFFLLIRKFTLKDALLWKLSASELKWLMMKPHTDVTL